ncbi:MAG: chemotaxis protein CheB [Burkholderiales bacterium]
MKKTQPSAAKKKIAPAARARKAAPSAAILRCPVVGIGASAGGLEALEQLFRQMPTDTGMAFVVVTHQHPGHTSMLPELLGRVTKLPVTVASDGVRLRPNRVYLNPPGGYLALINGALQRMDANTSAALRLPIDYFLRSLAADQHEKAICIILSGTGTDGTLGLKAVKAGLGMAMVQEAASAKYSGMPSSAVATGLADFILPAADMPRQLVAYARGPYLATAAAAQAAELPAAPLQKIFVLLRARTGHDFSGYKGNTVRRRIERRMNLHQIKSPTQYVRYLQENAQEIDLLFKELLISVTSFFRDAEASNALFASALPALVDSRPETDILRAWVPGCATGEEVFSLAILIRECMASMKRHCEVQIFGTDLDSAAIEAARNGRYPEGIAAEVSAQRLERYFVHEGSGFRVRKDIRDMAIFAVQNVIKDPPFTKLDLISCRNVLIYLNADLQQRLLPLFHYALRPGGLLLLGPSENIGTATDLFDVVDKRWKIFRRKETVASVHPALVFPATRMTARIGSHEAPAVRPAKDVNIAGIVERALLGRFAPASVVVNGQGDVVYIHGRTGAYLEPAAGKPRASLLSMAREGLQLELGAALREAAAHDREVHRENVHVKSNGGFVQVGLTVWKLNEPESVRGLMLVTFRPGAAEPATPERPGPSRRSSRASLLERELQATKDSLQSTIEEVETANEELKSTNEELQSTNEELQSANEELQTSKEEMESLNEELTTVNTELESKVDELSRASDDMRNLLNSTQIATIFLDRTMRIRRFTEEAKKLINLIPADVGRPIADLNSRLDHAALAADCQAVLGTLVLKERQVRAHSGQWYLMRIIPFRTAENVIDGLVLTFVDISVVADAQAGLRRMAAIVKDSNDAIAVLTFTGAITAWNHGAERLYGWTEAEALKMNITDLTPATQRAAINTVLERLRSAEAIEPFDTERIAKDGRVVRARAAVSLLVDDVGRPVAVATTERDITGAI